MGRRLTSAVMIAALLLQALVVTPVTFASAASSHSTPSHCAEHVGTTKQHCPCCPTGEAVAAGCMSLCTAVSAASVLPVHSVQPSNSAAIPFIAPPALTQTYAPPNPPPIG